jgi:hypothetical protein
MATANGKLTGSTKVLLRTMILTPVCEPCAGPPSGTEFSVTRSSRVRASKLPGVPGSPDRGELFGKTLPYIFVVTPQRGQDACADSVGVIEEPEE